MGGNFDISELVNTLVDQAHQIRRLNEMVVIRELEIDRLSHELGEAKKELEAKQVAADIAAAAPQPEGAIDEAHEQAIAEATEAVTHPRKKS